MFFGGDPYGRNIWYAFRLNETDSCSRLHDERHREIPRWKALLALSREEITDILLRNGTLVAFDERFERYGESWPKYRVFNCRSIDASLKF